MEKPNDPHFLANTVQPGRQPTAIIVMGQPDADLRALKEQSLDDLKRYGGAAVVDRDAVRTYDSGTGEALAAHPASADEKDSDDEGRRANDLTVLAAKQRRNIVIDGTLNRSNNAHVISDNLRAMGYDVEIRVLAVSRERDHAGRAASVELATSLQRVQANGMRVRVNDPNIDDPASVELATSLQGMQANVVRVRVNAPNTGDPASVELATSLQGMQANDMRVRGNAPNTGAPATEELATSLQRMQANGIRVKVYEPSAGDPDRKRRMEPFHTTELSQMNSGSAAKAFDPGYRIKDDEELRAVRRTWAERKAGRITSERADGQITKS